MYLGAERASGEGIGPVRGTHVEDDVPRTDAPESLAEVTFFALEGVSELMNTLGRVQRALNPVLDVEGVLLTMVDERNNLTQQVRTEAQAYFKERLFRTIVPRSVRLAEAPSFGKPILLYDIRSKGAQAYLVLAKEIMAHEEKGAGQGPVGAPARS